MANPAWRVYLDNYDLLEKVTATGMVEVEGTAAESILALRSEYARWEVPRNEKKAVQRSSRCELQGATIDGTHGLAFPKEAKLSKYFSLALTLLGQKVVTQRQMQVVCGGLVYFTMFRRPMLSCLNAVWSFIESFNAPGAVARPLPSDCRLELLRFIGLLPLVRMNFRLDMHPMVTCSDASTTGGGICRSEGLTPVGSMVSEGGLRGQLPQPLVEHARCRPFRRHWGPQGRDGPPVGSGLWIHFGRKEPCSSACGGSPLPGCRTLRGRRGDHHGGCARVELEILTVQFGDRGCGTPMSGGLGVEF